MCAVNDRGGKPDKHSIPRNDAWDHVAKMLFPDHELVRTFVRDRWLIDRYCPPNNPPNEIILKNQPASLLPGGITYISGMVSQGRTGFAPVYQDSGKIFPPKKLIAKVDRAYFRQSLREDVHRWFARHGFDRAQRTIPKHLFEAAVQAEFGQLLPEPVKPATDDALVAEAIEGLKSEKYPNVWQAAQALAPRAKGSDIGTSITPYSAKVYRLNKKIGNAYKNLKTISKHLKTNKMS